MSETNEKEVSSITKLVESGAMVAIATVLSLIKIIDLPYGGSVTIASMLPIVIVSYRHGIKWGLLSGVVFGAIQQLMGLNTLTYVTTWQSILAVILLDYIVAFAVTGLGGVLRKKLPQPQALMSGAILVCVLRYICHVISGATVWAGLSIPTEAVLIYSMGYNATYMIPETIVTATVAYLIGTSLDFGRNPIGPMKRSETDKFSVSGLIAGLLLTIALIFDCVLVFSNLQNGESGEFDITGLSSVNWTVLLIVSIIAVIAAILINALSGRNAKKADGEA